jgi:hypothetical protein
VVGHADFAETHFDCMGGIFHRFANGMTAEGGMHVIIRGLHASNVSLKDWRIKDIPLEIGNQKEWAGIV